THRPTLFPYPTLFRSQVDEVNMAFLCDPNLREFARSLGEDPGRLPHTYATLLNDATAARPPDMAVCMHLCRGNARSHWVAAGGRSEEHTSELQSRSDL